MEIEANSSYVKNQKLVALVVKITITTALIYWIIAQIEITQLLNTLQSTKASYLIAAIAIHSLAFMLFSVRWWYLYHIQDRNCKYAQIVGSYYLGLFFNNILPTGMGGDVVRILRLKGKGLNTHILVSSTLVDRILGLVSILLMGLVAVIFTPNLDLSADIKMVIAALGIALTLFLIFIFSNCTAKLANRFFNRENKFSHFIINIVSTLHEYRRKRTQVLGSLCISFVAQYLIIFCYLLIGASIGMDIPFSIYFTIIPIVFVASSLPISIGGLGVRESVLVSLLLFFQVDPQMAIALSLLYFAIIVLITLPGAILIANKNLYK